jgi:cytidine deaminase
MTTNDDPRIASLVASARLAAGRAYAPYSRFHVGASVLSDSGAVFSGCNVENASYGLTLCAERNAIFQMVAAGERSFALLVIYTPTAEPTPPCGACRQVLSEFSREAVILSVCDGPATRRATVSDLLPGAFDLAKP